MSKHRWIAELQDANGKALEHHSFDLEPEHYETRNEWNAAHRSWYWFRQRERKNLRGFSGPKSGVTFAVSWFQPDNPIVDLNQLNIRHHKTLWDLYDAIGYCYKRKRYTRQLETEHEKD